MTRAARAAAVALAGAASLAVVFRVQLLTRFGQLWGDQFDGGIEAAVLEHWFNVLRGWEPWNRTAYFAPYADTLGYNDGYLLYGLLHAAFRAAGADVFVASALVDMAVRAVGFAAMFLLLRRAANCRFPFALWGACVFTLAHGLFKHSVHQQLLSAAFAPALALLAWHAWRALAAGRTRAFMAWGAASGLFWGAWLLTAFYMAWFCTLFAAVLALVAVPVAGRTRVRAAAGLVRRHPAACAAVVAVAVLSAVPFLVVYLPKLRETGGQAWWQIRYFLPRVNDLINLGPDSEMWGRLAPVACVACTRGNFEMTDGITPILLWAFAAGTLSFFGRNRRLLLAVALASTLCALLTVRWGGFAPWWLVWKLVPGAGGVRVVSRFLLFLSAPVVVVATAYAQDVAARIPRHIALLLAGLVLLEQAEPGYPMYTRKVELARLEVPPPPADCRAFYVSATEGSEAPGEVFLLYPHNVEAMLIAELIHLPTVNGHSTFDPPDWNFADPLRPDYEDRVRAYARAHGLVPGLCRLDLRTKRWDAPT